MSKNKDTVKLLIIQECTKVYPIMLEHCLKNLLNPGDILAPTICANRSSEAFRHCVERLQTAVHLNDLKMGTY